MGQFLTPAPVASFMASLFRPVSRPVRILDPGAGVGSLFSALVQELLRRNPLPPAISVVAYETDKSLAPHLQEAMRLCDDLCRQCHVPFSGTVLHEDFIAAAIRDTEEDFFRSRSSSFTHAILNPPYKKILSNSDTRRILSAAGLETSNLYSAFVWLAAKLLEPGGEIVAITPRSFCNGPYFRPFRKSLMESVGLRRFHVFQSRKETFKEDSVLQENVIFHGEREGEKQSTLTVSVSNGNDFSEMATREIPFDKVVLPGDLDAFIHLAEDDEALAIMEKMSSFRTTLDEIGLEISTGRVVDFRARSFLRERSEQGTVPLLYPCHLSNGFIRWPVEGGKKPNALVMAEETLSLLVASGFYVLTKRFSSKEERRRVVAAVCDPRRLNSDWLGFENHLNYFHARGKGLAFNLAKGLAVFLNSTVFDRHFRLFSGHTQVNALDLRRLRYPAKEQLVRMGKRVLDEMPSQQMLDEILTKECALDE